MKKVLAYFVAIAMLITSFATLIPASAGYVLPDDESEVLDLLEESGLGNPDYLQENNINLSSGTWVGHEDWNTNVGWDGFSAADGNGNPPFKTREIYETVKSDGTTGNVIRVINNNECNTGSETAIENIDLACGGFVDGTSYTARVVVKVANGAFNGHEMIVSWNSKPCTHETNTESKVVIPSDNKWHEVYVTYTYSTEGNGEYLYIAPCENWINPGAEYYIESVEVYETEALLETEGPLVLNGLGDFNRATVIDNSGASVLNAWAGWVDYVSGGAESSYRTVVETELSDGTTGKALKTAVEGTQGHGAALTNAKINTLKPSTHYKLTVVAKFTSESAYSNGNAAGVWGNGMGIGMAIGGSYVAYKRFSQANNGNWAKTTIEFVTPADLTAETEQVIALGAVNGENYCSPYEMLVESVELVEEDNLLFNADLENDLSVGWTAGWGNGGEQGYDTELSHTDDGTGSMYIYNEESAARHISQGIILKAGKSYLVGGWMKTDNTSAAPTIRLGGDDSPIALGNQTGTKDWTKFETVYTVGETDFSTSFQVRLWGASGKVWFDDLYIYEINAENPLTYLTSFSEGDAGTFTSGWMGGVSAGYSTDYDHTGDGTGSIKLVNGVYNESDELVGNNQHFSTKIFLVGGVKYSLSGWIKIADTFHCTGSGLSGAFISLTPTAGEYPSRAGIVNANELSIDWTYYSTDYTPETTGLYFLSLAQWGSNSLNSTVYFDDICITPYVNGASDSPFYAEENNTPTEDVFTDADSIFAGGAFADGTGLAAGWGNGVSLLGYYEGESHTDDGTGAAYIRNVANSCQILQLGTVALEKGHIYLLKGFVKTSDGLATNGAGGTGATLSWNDNYCGGWVSAADADWQEISVEFTAEATGDAPIQARIWGAEGTAWFDDVVVYDVTVFAESVTLDKESLELEVGGTAALVATVLPDNTTDPTVVWTSDDETVATVDEEGNVTAVGEGTAVITATCGNATASCPVTVTSVTPTGDSAIFFVLFAIAALAAVSFILVSKKREF